MLQTIKNPTNMKMISCNTCLEPMPELRYTKYGYGYCVKCSEAGLGESKKVGIPILMGEGDHTWVETVIMTEDQYEQYVAQQKAEKKLDKSNIAEKLDFDKD
tara:strand:+ start:4265 stop:4570 length:306 start_codon:yes stop_codon:yes gene_type:complete